MLTLTINIYANLASLLCIAQTEMSCCVTDRFYYFALGATPTCISTLLMLRTLSQSARIDSILLYSATFSVKCLNFNCILAGFRLALIQFAVGSNKAENLKRRGTELVAQAAKQGAQLLSLPVCTLQMKFSSCFATS